MVSSGTIMGLLQDPRALASGLSGGREGVHRFALGRLTASTRAQVDEAFQKLEGDKEFEASIGAKLNAAGRPLGEIGRPRDLYAICRLLRPKVVVETGVASGMSSAYVLQSLHDNQEGRLYSIDLPNADTEALLGKVLTTLPEGRGPGWLVPEWLRDRWDLRIGKSADLLPPLLEELGRLDIFLHDSEHSFENMMFEFNAAWPRLGSRGLLLSDDVDMPVTRGAFYEFAKQVGTAPSKLYSPIGAIRKR